MDGIRRHAARQMGFLTADRLASDWLYRSEVRPGGGALNNAARPQT